MSVPDVRASIYLEMKYDSGTGWPSFTSIEGNLETRL